MPVFLEEVLVQRQSMRTEEATARNQELAFCLGGLRTQAALQIE